VIANWQSVESGQAQTLTFGEEQQPSETLNALLGLKDERAGLSFVHPN
jgi:hypothetical protein